MEHKHESDDLPRELANELAALGEARAPDELWHRVVLAREGLTPAPAALWERVAPVVREIAYPDVVTSEPVRPLLVFSRPMAAAAAILLLVGGSLSMAASPQATAPGYKMAQGPREALLAYTRSLYGSIEQTTVSPDELSPAARTLARDLGLRIEEAKS